MEILRENARFQARTEKPVDLTSRSNRRRRDYLMLLIGGNLVIFLTLYAIGGLALGGVVAAVFTLVITWALYGILDKY